MFGFDVQKPQKIDLPIIMYHSVCNWRNNDYVISTDTLERDLKLILQRGYTPIFMRQAIDFVDGKAAIPKKPIVISFDDGFYNNFTLVLPILQKYNVKAVVSLVGKYSEVEQEREYRHNYYSYLRFNEVCKMAESGLIEFCNHSFNMHKLTRYRRGVGKAGGETEENYKAVLHEDALKNERIYSENCSLKFNTFTYPYGSYSKNTSNYLSQIGYRAFLTCNEGRNTIVKGDIDCLRELKRYNRPSKYSSEYFFDRVCKLNREDN